MSKTKLTLFEDNDEEDGELRINKAYASKYEQWRRGEELSKLKNRYGDDATLSSSESESSDDDYVEPDNREFDHDFLVTMGALHKKELLSEKDQFFQGDYRKKKTEGEKDEAMTIRDYQQHIIFNRQGELDEEVNGGPHPSSNVLLEKSTGAKFEDGISSDDDGGDGLLTSGLFKVKSSDDENKKHKRRKLDDDAVAFVKGESTSLSNTKDKEMLEGLKAAWNNPHIPREDKWLADFFLNKRYLEDEDESVEREYNEVIIDEETLSEDEKTLETMDKFETKYRFRYEEPDKDFIKKYPRTIQESVRPKDERRRLKNQALKQRKLKEKELKKQEIEKLKALKYEEIKSKLEKIKEASGNDEIDFLDNDLDDDFDPEAHDSAMSRMFGDDYYTQNDSSDEKPAFECDDNDIIKDYDDWLEKEAHSTSRRVEDEANGTQQEYECEDGEFGYDLDFNMDADYEEESHSKKDLQMMMKKASHKKGRSRQSKFAEVLAKKKPVFDPQEKKFESYFDEYYQLDFEDLIGGMPCRFQYRQVQANNFGLSTEEILNAQDKELNKWYSLRKLLQYDRSEEQEKHDNNMYTHRATIPRVKQRVLPSLFNPDPEEAQEAEQEKKRIKNLKKKLRRQQKQERKEDIKSSPLLAEKNLRMQQKQVETGDIRNSPPLKKKRRRQQKHGKKEDNKNSPLLKPREKQEILTDAGSSEKPSIQPLDNARKAIKRKKHKKPLHDKATGQVLPGVSDARLAAYGQNPKQLKKKAKFGKGNLEGKISATFVQ